MTGDLEQARRLMRAGDWAPALDIAWQAHVAAPHDDQPLRIAALALAHLGRLPAARKAADAAVAIAPSDARTWIARAHVDLVGDRVDDDTLRAAQRAAYLTPDHVNSFRVLASVLLARGDHDGALRALSVALRCDRNHASSVAELERAVADRREHRAEFHRVASEYSSPDASRRIAERMSRVVTYSLLALVAIVAPPVLTGVADLAAAAALTCVVGVVVLLVPVLPAMLVRSSTAVESRRPVTRRQRIRVACQLVALALMAGSAAAPENVGRWLAGLGVGVLAVDALSDARFRRPRAGPAIV